MIEIPCPCGLRVTGPESSVMDAFAAHDCPHHTPPPAGSTTSTVAAAVVIVALITAVAVMCVACLGVFR